MFPGLSPTEWVTVISFSLSLAALIARFLTKRDKGTAKLYLLTTVVVLAIVSGAVATANSLIWAASVDAVAERIYITIGNQERTTEQVLLELGPVEAKSFTEAFVLLQKRHLIESRVHQATLYRDRQVLVRLWRAVPE